MLTEIDPHELPPSSKAHPGKVETIREHLKLTPDEIAPKVGARTGAEILAYENDESFASKVRIALGSGQYRER